MNRQTWIYIFALILFGTNGLLARNIGLNPVLLIAIRSFLAQAVIFCFIISAKKFSFRHLIRHRHSAAMNFASGCALGVSWITLFTAYRLLGIGVSTLEYYLGPVFVLALGPVLFNTKLTRVHLVGFSAVLVGVSLIILPGNISFDPYGIFLGFCAAMGYVSMVIFTRKANSELDSMMAIYLQLLGACFISICFVLWEIVDPWTLQQMYSSVLSMTFASWINLAILGIVNTGIGCYLYFFGLRTIDVRSVVILGYLEPLSAVLLSTIFLHEQFGGVQAVGTALIIVGAIISELDKGQIRSLFSKSKARLEPIHQLFK